MMKVMKKIATFLVCLCMMVGMVPTVAHAASGELRFSDPSTTVGAKFEVTAKMSADYYIESGEATLSYDTNYLRFVSGDGATDNGGTITLTGTAAGSYEINWTLEFQALAEGSTKIEISDVSATDTDGDSIDITRGSSAIAIGEGDPSLIEDVTVAGEQVDVNGVTYSIATEISELLVPAGFVVSEMNYNGTTYPAIVQESSGMTAMFLMSSSDEGEFFIYDVETNSFLPFYQINISPERYVIILSDEEKTGELPEYLQQTTMTINEKEFVAWQNVENPEYYVIYALNSDGVEGYYQYDTVDGTYQRYTPEEAAEEVVEESTEPVDQFLALVEDNLLVCILGAVFAILFLLLLLIIVAIKLRHRNIELDDLYEEYGIDEDEEAQEEPVEAKKEKKGLFGKKKSEEDDYDEDDLEDDFEEDDYEEDDYEEDELDLFDSEEDDSEEDDLEELNAILNSRVKTPAVHKSADVQKKETVKEAPRKATSKAPQSRRSSKPVVKQEEVQKPAVKPAAPRRAVQQPVAPKVGKPQQKVGHSDLDDTFKMDLIDLD